MKRSNWKLLLGLASALWLAPGPARGEVGGLKPFALRLDLGRVRFREAGFGDGWRYGGGLIFRTGRRAGVEVLLERFAVPVEKGAGGEPVITAGEMKVTSLAVHQYFLLLQRGRLRPFVIVGFALCFIGFSPGDPAARPGIDIVDRLALQWGAGLEYRVAPILAVSAGARCTMIRTWAEELPRTEPYRNTITDAKNILHLYGLDLSLGLRFSL